LDKRKINDGLIVNYTGDVTGAGGYTVKVTEDVTGVFENEEQVYF
jgi:hypothetical protein